MKDIASISLTLVSLVVCVYTGLPKGIYCPIWNYFYASLGYQIKVVEMSTVYIGDTSKFIDTGLDEPNLFWHECPVCHYEKEVVMEYHLFPRGWYPADARDLICPECFNTMDLI